MLTFLLALQAAAQPLPDIELKADVEARRVKIERAENVRLDVSASPDGGSDVQVNRNANAASGRKTLRNVRVRVQGAARLAGPDATAQINVEPPETPQP